MIAMKHLLFLAVAVLSLYGGIRLYYHFTDGFCLENISSDFPYDERWAGPALQPEEERELSGILAQEFRYLGKGCQSYVFESGEYVLKFFKYHRYRNQKWVSYFTFIPGIEELLQKKMAKKTKKREGVFSSWMVAYKHAKPETGLIYVHLNKSSHLQKKLTIYDKMGNQHILDIDNFEFLIQKKATMLTDYIERQMLKDNEPEVLAFLDTLVGMIKGEYTRGIADNDPALMQNTGVIAGVPVHIDVGQFDISQKYQDPEVYEVQIFHKFFKFRRWLTKNYPAAGKRLDELLLNEFGEPFFQITPNPRYL
jgi:hypothetical protein